MTQTAMEKVIAAAFADEEVKAALLNEETFAATVVEILGDETLTEEEISQVKAALQETDENSKMKEADDAESRGPGMTGS